LGQSKTKVQRFLMSNPTCIFCGGCTPASTQDHVPPRSIFIDRKWPDGYVFAACTKCNNESSDSEYLVSIMAKMGWGLIEGKEIDKSIYKSTFLELKVKKPDIFHKMQHGLSAAEKKRLAKEIGYIPPVGGLYADMPIIKFPDEVDSAIKIFGKKLAIALHYKHTNIIPPENFGFRLKWTTNFELLKGKFLLDQETLKAFAPARNLIREKVDLFDQFNYSYAITEDSKNSAFHCNFSKSFNLLFLLSFENIILDDEIA